MSDEFVKGFRRGKCRDCGLMQAHPTREFFHASSVRCSACGGFLDLAGAVRSDDAEQLMANAVSGGMVLAAKPKSAATPAVSSAGRKYPGRGDVARAKQIASGDRLLAAALLRAESNGRRGAFREGECRQAAIKPADYRDKFSEAVCPT